MDYPAEVSSTLKPWIDQELNKTVLDLFAGCGGLSLGFEACGFKTIGYEMNSNATNTYNNNLLGKCFNETLTTEMIYPAADIVIGGPPCQPFSVGGKQLGLKDSRDGFPIFIAAVKQLNPEVFLFENVRGMLYKNKWYLNEVLNELEELGYHLNYSILNAVNYNVPQNRERVIVIGSKKKITLPEPQLKKITAGDALGDLALQYDENSKFFTESMDRYVANYEKASKCINPRDLYLDRPARTLTCRNLAGATGDMHRIKLPDGRRRRVSIREAARLQSFPDWFEFLGNETSQFTQIGNAVAPYFAYHLALKIKKYILGEDKSPIYPNTSQNQLKLFENEAIS
jgi:DNA (cytosine-5)-methyltransferase 1